MKDINYSSELSPNPTFISLIPSVKQGSEVNLLVCQQQRGPNYITRIIEATPGCDLDYHNTLNRVLQISDFNLTLHVSDNPLQAGQGLT